MSLGEQPVAVFEVELSELAGDLAAAQAGYREPRPARCLVRIHGIPLGIVELAPGWTAQHLLRAIDDRVGNAVASHMADDGLRCERPLRTAAIEAPDGLVCSGALPDDPPHVTAVVTTGGELEGALDCARSILACDYPRGRLEVIVVARGSIAAIRAEPLSGTLGDAARFRVMSYPGASAAAARALGACRAVGDIVAFARDDVRVDRDWVRRLAVAFSTHADATCVAGLVLPVELDAPVSFDKLTRPASLDNMAVRGAALEHLRAFDPDADENFEQSVTLRTMGFRLVYEPSALAWRSGKAVRHTALALVTTPEPA